MKKNLLLFLSALLFNACSLTKDSSTLNYKAIGQEPPWTVEIKNDSLIFIYGYERDSTIYRAFEHGSTERKIVFNSRAEGKTIKVVFHKEECMDIMSGERYPYKAEVERDTLKLKGCAKEIFADSIKTREDL